jgi:hypothetical protein
LWPLRPKTCSITSTAPTALPGALLSPNWKICSFCSVAPWAPNCSNRLYNVRLICPFLLNCSLVPIVLVRSPCSLLNLAVSTPALALLTGKNPLDTAPAVGGIFFPQSKSLGIDLTEHSPAVQQKIVYAGVVASSFAKAAELLDCLAELPIATKQVERLTRRIGSERVAQRDGTVAAFESLPLTQKFDAPADVSPAELAVIQVDGGRLQIRKRDGHTKAASVQEKPTQSEAEFDEEMPAKGFWRENKLGVLLEMQSEVKQTDPCAEVAPGFIDVLRIPILAREIGKVAAQQEDELAQPLEPAPLDETDKQPPAYQAPEVEHRSVVATCQPWWSFALLLAQAAHAAGFQKAERKAFVADGSANNWRLHRRFFSSFVPVLDFIHALSYVYAAAQAGRQFAEGWECYRRWITWLWKGEVKRLIEELRQRQEEVGLPQEGESETSVASVVARGLTYLSNHQDKMKYDEYRKAGLPLTSSVMESTVKQMNQRVKGTEKFWCSEGAEAIVHLRADYLSDDKPLDDFFSQRQHNATGQRRSRAA